VLYPKDKPAFVLDIPSGWAIDRSALGLEARSPEKDSLVLAAALKRDKTGVEAWTKKAVTAMEAFGVSFDASAKPPPPASSTPQSDSGKPATDFTQTPDAFTFAGAPALSATQEGLSSDTTNALAAFGAPKPPSASRHKFRVVRYAGTTLKGQRVDVELAVSDLPAGRVFAAMQVSGSSDMRASAIVNSVQPGKVSTKAQ
jgi:hypothetical protein